MASGGAVQVHSHQRVVWVICALLLSIWCSVVAWSVVERQTTLAANALVLEELNAAVESQTHSLFKQVETSFMVANHWMATHPDQDPTRSADFLQLVKVLRDASNGMLDIRLATKAGQLRLLPDPGNTAPIGVADREYFQVQQSTSTQGFYVGKPVRSRLTQRWGIPVSVPVPQSGGDISVMLLTIEYSRIAGMFEAERMKPFGTIGIAHRDGEILFRSPVDERAIGKSLVNGDGWQHIYQTPAKGAYESHAGVIDGRQRMVSYSQVPGYPLLVYVSDSKTDLLRPWEQHTLMLVLVASLISVFGVAMGVALLRALSASRTAEAIVRSADEGIIGKSLDGVVNSWNPGAERIFGYSAEEMIGQSILKLIPPELVHQEHAILAQIRQGLGIDHLETVRLTKDGRRIDVSLTTSPIWDGRGHLIGASKIVRNISAEKAVQAQLKLQQERLEHSAHFDALTDLPNRLLLSDRLHQAMTHCQRHGQSLAVLYLDLDGFKRVNDLHGHKTGDDLLVAVSRRMKAALREVDTLARMGGDEFVAVLTDVTHPQDCMQLITRILAACAEPVHINGLDLSITASIGVTIYPQDSAEADQLMRHADQAMYEAKQSGKNRFHIFDSAQDAEVKTRGIAQDNVAQGLARQEFVLFYQPKVNMRTGRVVGAEALIRWQHPERGLLPPSTFLPAIEHHALNEAVGAWVLQSALQQMRVWKEQGLDLKVSVNIAARQLQQGDFATGLATLLQQYADVDPRQLELEVLETSALDNIAATAQVLQDCQSLGVRFAIDDFGTGYSSLTYLRHLPVETLKIDQSFVRDMLEDQNDLSIVKGVIGLALAFGREVIAEGVESVAHGKLLIELGCELAQGYAIARPMPATLFATWRDGWTPPAEWTTACAV